MTFSANKYTDDIVSY